LYENRNNAKSDLDAARAAYESGMASLRSIEKQLEMARLKLGYTQLYAPVDGSIARVIAEVNENVGAGTPVVVLTSGKKLEVQVAIPEMLIAGIREGDKAEVTAGALQGKIFDAVIKEVGVASTGIGSTFPVSVQIQEEAPGLRSGMTADVTLYFKSTGKKDRIIIIVPTFAVGEDREGRFVFTVNPLDKYYGTIERKTVKIGDITTGGIEILEGLNEGEKVVTAGISKITPGQKVKLPAKDREKQR
jgi:RND family efflux transporter MFP subunit